MFEGCDGMQSSGCPREMSLDPGWTFLCWNLLCVLSGLMGWGGFLLDSEQNMNLGFVLTEKIPRGIILDIVFDHFFKQTLGHLLPPTSGETTPHSLQHHLPSITLSSIPRCLLYHSLSNITTLIISTVVTGSISSNIWLWEMCYSL